MKPEQALQAVLGAYMERSGGHLLSSNELHCGGEDGCGDAGEWDLFGFPLHPQPGGLNPMVWLGEIHDVRAAVTKSGRRIDRGSPGNP